MNLHFKIPEIQNTSKLQIRCEYDLTLNHCFAWTANVERPLEQNWPLLCLTVGGCLCFHYSFGASPGTKSAFEKAPGVQFGILDCHFHKMTSQKEVVAAALQFYQCAKV